MRPANCPMAAAPALHSRRSCPYRSHQEGDVKAPPKEIMGRIMKTIAHLVACILLLSLPATAHTPQQPPHQLYNEGDLKLESGEAIKDFSISYVTHGTLNAERSNAILMVTAIAGNHHRLAFMIGPGKALDPA